MGVPSVGSTADEERDGEDTDQENPSMGVADDSVQNADSSSGAVEGSWELEAPTFFLEVLNRNRFPRLDVPAAYGMHKS